MSMEDGVPMTLNEYQYAAMRTAGASSLEDAGILVPALGLAGEAGEFANAVKKYVFHGHPFDGQKLDDEAGDILWYLALYATEAGTTLEQLAQQNIKKLEERYPDGFVSERSINRSR